MKSIRYEAKNNGMYRPLSVVALLVSLGLSFWFSAPLAQAQETAQVVITGIPGVLSAPFITDLEDNYNSDIYQVQFIYNAPGSMEPRAFEFVVTVTKNGNTLIEERSDPVFFEPGTHFLVPFFDEVPFNIDLEDVIDGFDSSLRNQLLQSGALPEGNYSIRISPEAVNMQPIVSGIPGISNFVVRFPQPPILVTPPDESVVSLAMPFFTWTPVTVPGSVMVEYDFLLVEMMRGQNPGDALLSNRPHHQQTLTGTSLPYTPDLLPLEEGAKYAWQVTARDANDELPFAREGESEIYSFVFGRDEGEEVPPERLTTINLVPGMADLTNLDGLEISRSGGELILFGEAVAELQFADGRQGEVRAMVNDLRILEGSLPQAVITGGSVELSVSQTESLTRDWLPDFIALEEVIWQQGLGLTARVSTRLPLGDRAVSDSHLTFTPGGLSGMANISGSPLAAYQSEWVDMTLIGMSVSFPDLNVTAEGDITVMDQDTGCDLTGLNAAGGELSASFSCNQTFTLPLVEGSALLSFETDQILGNVGIDLDDGSLSYDLSLRATLGLLTTQGNYCGTNMNIGINSDEPLSLVPGAASCTEPMPRLNLGFAELAFRNLAFDELNYDPASSEWDFEISLDASLAIPAFDGWLSPEIESLTLNKDGIRFESIDFGAGAQPLPNFNIQQLNVTLDAFQLSEFDFPVFDWDGFGPGPWEIAFGGSATVLSASSMPYCLIGTALSVENGSIRQNRVAADLSLADFEGCAVELSPFVTLELTGLSGTAGAEYMDDGSVEPFGSLQAGGGISFDSPFSCEAGETTPFSAGTLTFADGVQGAVTNVVPDCPVEIGPFTAEVTESAVSFSREPGQPQQAVMSAEASIALADGQTASGTFSLNLMDGTFDDVAFEIQGPFEWNLPSDENPLLTFSLSSAAITQDGLFIDGRQDFLLGDEVRRVTFDNLLLSLENRNIKSGRILFDESFAVEVGIGESLDALSFAATLPETPLIADPGLKMALSGSVQVDSAGVRASGSAEASLAFNDRRFDSFLSVTYSDDFAVGFNPVGVNSGEATFYLEGAPVATLDQGGFHPVWAYFAEHLLPERLPMPTESIAYIQLREDEELLVSLTDDGEGNLIISSLPDQPLSMVVPWLDPANPPEIADISFDAFTVTANPLNPEVVSGRIIADVPEGSPFFDLSDKNIPLDLRRIEYGKAHADAASALFLTGHLNLFDQSLEGDQEVAFFLQGNGLVQADLNLTDLGASLALLPGEQVKLGLDAVAGTFSMPATGGNPTYDFSLDGSMEILTEQGYRAGADLTLRAMQDGYLSITAFDSYAFDEGPRLNIGDFGLELEAIAEMPLFSWSPVSGFEFAVELDLAIDIPLPEDEVLHFPLTGVEIRNDGIQIPSQNISEALIPGLSLPEISLAGFTLEPLALRTPESVLFSWDDGFSVDPGFMFDFSLRLPEFEGTAIDLPDGLLFENVGFDDGFLVGDFDFPLDGAVPIGSGETPPTLLVDQISGALAKVPSNSFRQALDLTITGEVGNLPVFENAEDGCTHAAAFSLAIIEGRAFEGSISGLQPCGSLALGPVELEVLSADLNLYLDEGQQQAELDGAVSLSLPVREGAEPGTVTGSLVLDVLSGTIRDGAVAITEPFDLGMPWNDDDPLVSFAVNEAELSAEGLTLTGGGELLRDELDVAVSFDNLLIGLDTFSIKSGSATLSAGFSVLVPLNPLSFALIPTEESTPEGNALRFNATSDVILDAGGLGFTGAAEAVINYQGESYSNLRVELEDDFAVSLSGLQVNNGRALFFWDQDGEPATEPVAILDSGGFTLGGGLIALLPDRIPLPSESIAYIEIKDEEGNPLIEVDTDGSGYILSTGDSFLPLVIPALPDSQGEDFEINVSFSLQTDDAYNVTGGSIGVQSSQTLEDRLNLPVRLRELALSNDEGLQLELGLAFDLPEIFNEHEATVFANLTQEGIASASFTAGSYSTTYDPVAEPLYTFSREGSVDEGDSEDTFRASLMGIEAAFGPNALSIAATFHSSLILEQDDDPVFAAATWSAEGWAFSVDPGSALQDLSLGQAVISLDGDNPLEIVSTEEAFYLSLNGVVNLDEVLGEPLELTIQAMEVGVSGLNASPSLHFALGGAAAAIGDQYLSLFNNNLELALLSPTLSLSGRSLAVSADGNITFLDQELAFQGLMFSTDGSFEIGEAGLENMAVELAGEYITLERIALAYEEGLRFEAGFGIQLPEPFDEYTGDSGLELVIYRNESGDVIVEGGGLEFTPDPDAATVNLGEVAEARLTRLRADIDPAGEGEVGLFANAVLAVQTTEGLTDVIMFGEDNNFSERPGIGISHSQSTGLVIAYDVTGNAAFDIEFSFFELSLLADIGASETESFFINLSGTANFTLPEVEASITYENFRIGPQGVADWGNIAGSEHSVTIAGFATLEVGSFIRELDADGFDLTFTDTSGGDNPDPAALRNSSEDELETTTISGVTELICFGPCPADIGNGSAGGNGGNGGEEGLPAVNLTIGAGGDSEGGFTGQVNTVFFYRTLSGDMSLIVEGFGVSVSSYFSMTADLEYVRQGSDILIRAAATGAMQMGDVQAAAVVAGKFANTTEGVSYGLFVGVSASPGIPIVPGVVDITGAAGGFFYRPEAEDFELVQTALQGFDYTLYDEDAATLQNGALFAAMLYASVGIGGGSGAPYVVEGATFMQLTNQSFYIDVQGTVAQMDGGENAVANTRVQAGMFASAEWGDDGISSLIFGAMVNLEVPLVIDGTGKVDFFYVREESGSSATTAWGLIGDVDFEIYGGIIRGESTVLAGPPGFLIELGLGIYADVFVFSIESNLMGSAWVLTDESYSMPFGAYAIFDVEICAFGGCASAEARGAFVVHQSEGYELFASAKGCLGEDRFCISGWASFTGQGATGGLGSGEHNDVIAQAQAQRDQFEDDILSLIAGLEAIVNPEAEPIPLDVLFPDDEMFAQAATRFYSVREDNRKAWAANLLANEQGDGLEPLPQSLQNVLNNIMGADRPSYNWLSTPANAEGLLNQWFESLTDNIDELKDSLGQDLGTAIVLMEDSEQYFDNLSEAFFTSPVSGVVRPEVVEGQNQSVSFEVDDSRAENQAQATSELRENLQQLDMQFRESIASVEENVSVMRTLVIGSFAPPPYGNLRTLMTDHIYLIEYFERKFASYANYRWTNYSWANNLLEQLSQNQTQIAQGVSTVNQFYSSALQNAVTNPTAQRIQRLNDEAARLAKRVQFVYHTYNSNPAPGMDPDLFPFILPEPSQSAFSEVQELYDRLSWPISGNDIPAVIMNQVANANTSYWYQMHVDGLQSYADAQKVAMDNPALLMQMNQEREDYFAHHKNLTQIMDSFFSVKAGTIAILWNLYDNYVDWRQQNEGSGFIADAPPVSEFVNKRQQLSEELMPPQLTALTVTPGRTEGTFVNRAEVSWTAQHPQGIIENAVEYRIQLGGGADSDITIRTDDYLSIGNSNSVTLPAFKLFSIFDTAYINMGVRVRGTAGNTAIRRASFPVDVGPGGTTTPPGSNVFPEETDPPQAPVVLLSENYNASVEAGVVRYWTNAEGPMHLVIQGHDPQVGIRHFEYAVGTTPGATDVIDWNELQGNRELITAIPAEEIRGPARFFPMDEGQEYYVSARVENNMGQMSPVANADGPIILDLSEPGAPLAGIQTPDPVQPPIDWPSVYPAVTSVPPLSHTLAEGFGWITTYGDPELFFSNISAEDPVSGISHFEYVLSRSETPPHARFAAGDYELHESGELHITGGSDHPVLDTFRREVYLHLRAVDNAGNRSDITTSGPHLSFDSTVPEAGEMRAKLDPDDVKVYLTSVPYDPESDVLGLQYRVVYYDGGWDTTVRPFPTGTDVDLEWNHAKSVKVVQGLNPQPRHISIPRSELPVGPNLYVQFRSVNTKGSFSALGETGPINLDTTPPVTPDLSVSANTDTRRITIGIDNIHDPESGVVKVEYEVRRSPFWMPAINPVDQQVIYHQPYPDTTPFELETESMVIPDDLDLAGLRVTVRIHNHAGLVRTRHHTIQDSDLFTPIVYPPPVFVVPPGLGF
ncbi:hypothetical protein CYPRO_0093 [Cyclonatronum proteinivorum]|uniref:Por secretion system C-terminal sorting domain-containing protein n=1 Tax=Cyclonatronum proteinivorum TaxID=1457365 RepID=A0A345UFX9_9BACT|nr:hypothetical protein [Cyclonatronum proteinivorum]AXI99380.1 hypothetical protein CYPRO_0093 [Cyclonatronum proteinivorum]